MESKVYAWHFTNSMKYRDGTELVVGEPCKPIEDIELCSRGYHASENIMDALGHAPGTFLSRTEHSGVIYRSHDKLCSQERTPLWTIDATNLLADFAQACAVSAGISARYAAAAAAAADAARYTAARYAAARYAAARYAAAAAAAAADVARYAAAADAAAAAAAADAAAAAAADAAAADAAAADAAAANAAANADAAAANAAANAARYARYARYAANYAARYAAAAHYAAVAGAAGAREWQGVVLLQLVSNEYDRLVQEQYGNT